MEPRDTVVNKTCKAPCFVRAPTGELRDGHKRNKRAITNSGCLYEGRVHGVIKKTTGSTYLRPVAREALSQDRAFQLRPQV